MGRKGRSGDLRYIVMLQLLMSEGASMADKGKVVREALMSGWELRPLARAVGVHHKAVQKWLKVVEGEDDMGRGRPRELLPTHKAVLLRLASNPSTSHLPAKILWEMYLQRFECSPKCCQSPECPHETVSYYTALRFLQSIPAAYREGKLRLRKRFRAAHTSLVPAGQVWLADRSKTDVMLIRDEWKGEVQRYEIAAIVDQGTMTVLAIAAVEREVEGKFSPYFDAAAFNSLFADALLGELTGIQAKPQTLKVKGKSMEPTLLEGDYIGVRQQEVATTGDIVVAQIDEFDEVTVKRLKQIATEIILVPDNPEFPSYSSRHHRIHIIGKVTWVKRFMER